MRLGSLAVPALGLALLLGLLGTGCAEQTAVDRSENEGTSTGFVSSGGLVTTVPPTEREQAVPFAGPMLGGGELDVADLRGQVVVLNVWGSWCAPCRAEAPALQSAYLLTKAAGVEFVGVNTRDTPPQAQAFVEEFEITYPSIEDQNGRLLLAFRDTLPPAAIPSTLVLDSQGRVAARILGEVSETTLVTIIDEVAAEDPDPGVSS